ncbi:MAG: hypothetical protein M4D80_17265 [Myxococcota bacterium]|nr:hypothetical protein [Deltaproteobacteria bacterium]MDQ3336913.1 hypothetical protein [Myxococcota bacterium]
MPNNQTISSHHLVASALGLALGACADPSMDLATESDEPIFSILESDETTGTRGEIRTGDVGIEFQTSRSIDADGEARLGVLFTDLDGASVGPGESDEGRLAALGHLQRATEAADVDGVLKEDLGVVAVASAFLVSSATPAGVSARTTTVKSCSPDGGAHRASSQVVYLMDGSSYRTSGYWMLYQRFSGFSIGSHSDEYLVGSEWSWQSADSAPVNQWFFRSMTKRGVGGVGIKARFDKPLASDPSCRMDHQLR